MRAGPFSSRTVLLLAVATLALVSTAQAAPKFKVLHAFGQGQDGAGLWGNLALDSKGNLYGMTEGGGTSCCGIVFQLAPHRSGRWTEAILQELSCKDSEEGCMPESGFVLDAAGNLYGMSSGGGGQGAGTVFELSPGSGGWTATVLYDGGGWANLVLDETGNIYGPMASYGQYGGGAISELVKDQGWAAKWVYSFCPRDPCVDGAWPRAGVTWGSDGSLYGTTISGGTGTYGVVFRLTPQQDGTWKETVLHSFPSFKNDGQKPYDGVILDQSGNVYGATFQGGGGGYNCGVIFKLSPTGSRWKETILYDFPDPSKGCGSNNLTFDAKGNLWSTGGGGTGSCNGGCGVVFKLMPQANGKWKYNVAHYFDGSDGVYSNAAVVFDKQGYLYGTTILGGAYGGGVVFELTP